VVRAPFPPQASVKRLSVQECNRTNLKAFGVWGPHKVAGDEVDDGPTLPARLLADFAKHPIHLPSADLPSFANKALDKQFPQWLA
jgi:hypothetical protein